ncbi:MAG: glycosyltransferase family 4 protein [Spirochaetaceae bacterium]|jgi:glycosyltransferase involved in cell wall biosynthesis|nr:glycosyltransferase family 4 protein [Spirochaetaceae bacterium]
MSKILINGYFLCGRLTGIERYAREITLRLDMLSAPGEISIIVPSNAGDIPPYKNITVIKYMKKVPKIFWQNLVLQFFLLTRRQYTILDFGNTCLPLAPGIVFLHDIYCEFFPEDFTGFRDKLARLYNRAQYRLIARKAKKIVTVSQFSKNQIAETYHVDPARISVIYSSWDHFAGIAADYSVFDDYPILSRPFYFSLGSISRRKNIKWIMAYATKHPYDLFAVSGSVLPTASSGEPPQSAPSNIMLMGYMPDARVKALMERCKAFILPSYYEGFGLTPLEALACGAPVIVSNAASLPEIYGDAARYIDPDNPDIDLDALLSQPVADPAPLLKKYSYEASAALVYDLIRDNG